MTSTSDAGGNDVMPLYFKTGLDSLIWGHTNIEMSKLKNLIFNLVSLAIKLLWNFIQIHPCTKFCVGMWDHSHTDWAALCTVIMAVPCECPWLPCGPPCWYRATLCATTVSVGTKLHYEHEKFCTCTLWATRILYAVHHLSLCSVILHFLPYESHAKCS